MPTINDIAIQLVSQFDYLDDWETRYSYLMDLGEKLSPFDEYKRVEENIVHGCMSQVWLQADYDGAVMNFSGTSDSNIVRGLMALLFALYHQQKPDDICTHNPEEFFAQLGLTKHLSPSRSNGFYAMTQKIKLLSHHNSS